MTDFSYWLLTRRAIRILRPRPLLLAMPGILGAEDATWLRGRDWALSITLKIWWDDKAAAKIQP